MGASLLRIIDAVLWAAVQERVQAVAKVYQRGEREPGVLRNRSNYEHAFDIARPTSGSETRGRALFPLDATELSTIEVLP